MRLFLIWVMAVEHIIINKRVLVINFTNVRVVSLTVLVDVKVFMIKVQTHMNEILE